MKECKYRHKEEFITGYWGDKKIIQTRYSCFGQKNAPSCGYRDVNDCDMAKPLEYTEFDRICDSGPERLAKVMVLMMQNAVENPMVINYEGVLAALNSEVKNEE